jgi:hypothetical protein
MSTRQRAANEDKAALVHIFEVLTDTLRPSSTKANPYHLIRDNVTIDTTSDLFTLDQDFLDGDIPLYIDYDNDILQYDVRGKAMSFTLGTKEKQRLLAVAIFWDTLAAQTPGGIPDVDGWYTLTNATLDAALRNAIAGQSRVAPLPTAGPTGTNFEKGTRRSVSDYKVFRDRKTWNQFQRGLLATAHMHGVGDILDVNSTIPTVPADLDLWNKKESFLFSVFTRVLVEPTSAEIIRRYSEPNSVEFGQSHTIYRDLKNAITLSLF